MRPLYLIDHYQKECDARIVSASGKNIALGNTIFYPNGGGQPGDEGTFVSNGQTYQVVAVSKQGGAIIHEVDREGLENGDQVHCAIDWERRYLLMRMHTAAHVLSAVINKHTGALITGNQLGLDESRIDFSLEVLNRDNINAYITEANDAMAKHIPVKTYFLSRGDAMKIPGVVKLANALPPSVSELHIVDIPGVDIQADGGTHVLNTGEIGTVILRRIENKGAKNRRIYFSLQP